MDKIHEDAWQLSVLLSAYASNWYISAEKGKVMISLINLEIVVYYVIAYNDRGKIW